MYIDCMATNGVSKIERFLKLMRDLSCADMISLFLLLILASSVYTLYRFLNDEDLIDKFLSNYTEVNSDKIPCTVREGTVRGGVTVYSITTGFAYRGNDRWIIGLHRDIKPNSDELFEYCKQLLLLVDYLHQAPPAIKDKIR